jgi:hypothetical protein
MKTRNILIIGVLLLVVVTLSSFVAGGKPALRELWAQNPEARANAVTSFMRNRLSMDDAQFDKAYQVNLKYARMVQPYLKNEQSIRENKEALKGINRQRNAELKTILTPEQVEKAKEIKKQMIAQFEMVLEEMKSND